jgi:mono/diheme cytochrome c family protein
LQQTTAVKGHGIFLGETVEKQGASLHPPPRSVIPGNSECRAFLRSLHVIFIIRCFPTATRAPIYSNPHNSKGAFPMHILSAGRSAATITAATMAALALSLSAPGALAQAKDKEARAPDRASLERGRYLVRIAGCNDCHTPGYALSGGKVPEQQWLTGDSLGWRGAWGTTYPGNLRLFMQKLSEDQWLKLAKSVEYRPPMPWFALRDMRERDLRDLYRYVRHLGPAGNPAPAYVPPGQEPKGPYVSFPTPPKP